MGDGGLFGEIGRTRSFTARCETDTKLFCLGADEATRLFCEHPQFAYHVMQLTARRLQVDSTRPGRADAPRWAPVSVRTNRSVDRSIQNFARRVCHLGRSDPDGPA
jgi:CRP-like cAMP-binding protein